MNKDEFRKLINDNYKAAMQDCQIPVGALSCLNPAEYFAYCLYHDIQERKEHPERYNTENESEVIKHLKYWINKEIDSVTKEEQSCDEKMLLFYEGELEALRRIKEWTDG